VREEKVVKWMSDIAPRGAQVTEACSFAAVERASLGAAVQTRGGDDWSCKGKRQRETGPRWAS